MPDGSDPESPGDPADDLYLEGLTALLDDVEALVAGAAPPGSAGDRQRLVIRFLDALLAHRQALALMCLGAEMLQDPEVGRRANELDRALHDRVTGGADLEQGIRCAVALAGTVATVMTAPATDVRTVRELGVRMSLAALDGHARRP